MVETESIISVIPTNRDCYRLWHGIRIKIKRSLNLDEYSRAILAADDMLNSIKETCGSICAKCLRDFVSSVHVILAYTDIDVPNDINTAYALVYSTDLYPFVSENINRDQVSSLRAAIAELALS